MPGKIDTHTHTNPLFPPQRPTERKYEGILGHSKGVCQTTLDPKKPVRSLPLWKIRIFGENAEKKAAFICP